MSFWALAKNLSTLPAHYFHSFDGDELVMTHLLKTKMGLLPIRFLFSAFASVYYNFIHLHAKAGQIVAPRQLYKIKLVLLDARFGGITATSNAQTLLQL